MLLIAVALRVCVCVYGYLCVEASFSKIEYLW
jgi:hypothetical protein